MEHNGRQVGVFAPRFYRNSKAPFPRPMPKKFQVRNNGHENRSCHLLTEAIVEAKVKLTRNGVDR